MRLHSTSILLLCALGACSRNNSSSSSLAIGEKASFSKVEHDELVRGALETPEIIAHGAKLFSLSFTGLDGAGRPETTGTGKRRLRRGQPRNFNRISGPDAGSCAACHNKPFAGGAGDNVANVFVMAQDYPHLNFDRGEGDRFEAHGLQDVGNERNTVGMFGSGYVELLAREMTQQLQWQRDNAKKLALREQRDVVVPLQSKGVDFGVLKVDKNGTVDTTRVEGVNTDLVIRPFHQKGVVVSLREFTNNALNHHHGIQSAERFAGDADGDGVKDEVLDGDVTSMVFFQATLPVPGRVWPGEAKARAAAERGEKLFVSIGCASCHAPSLELSSAVFAEPGPFNPKGNRGSETTPVKIDLAVHGQGQRLQPEPNGKIKVELYSDLRRHDLGAEVNNERLVQDGVPTASFLTSRLWGVANQGPWMHHGRATTLDEAIRMHGGEAASVRSKYVAMSVADRDAIVAFLKTLQVLPKDAKAREIVGPAPSRIGDEPGIVKHLDQTQIEEGKVDVATLFAHGKALFTADFNRLDGAGRPEATGTGATRNRRLDFESFNRISGPDANSCAGCHNQGGPGGGGDNVANVFVMAQRLPFVQFDSKRGDGFQEQHLDGVGNERNTLGMWGGGYVELLAREITRDLHAIRDRAKADAKRLHEVIEAKLTSKGIDYGSLKARPDGSVSVFPHGIDKDLIIRPFHQKGVVVSLREFTNNALNHHHGMQSSERFGKGVDHDKDGHKDEVTVGDVTAMTVFQALLRVPGQVLPKDAAKRLAVRQGEELFSRIGCAKCHVPNLRLEDPVYRDPNPYNPTGNLRQRDVKALVEIDLTKEGQKPRLERQQDGSVLVPVFTDFKRHDLGPDCDNEKLEQDQVPTALFLTRKLWGFASEPPFLHHGRATTLREVIEMHGGEAAGTRAAFRSLTSVEQKRVIDFLNSLRVLPEGSAPVLYR